MASAVRKLTGVGGDIRKIARLLQKEAPPGHMLAYINQEEADLLKARGGSGKPHADTGVPSFADVGDYTEFDTPMPGETQATNRALESARSEGESGASPSIRSYLPSYTEGADSGASVGLGGGAVPTTDASIAAAGERFKTPSELGFQPGGSYPSTIDPNVVAAAAAIPTPREQGFAPGGSTPTDVKNVEPGFFEGMTDDTKKRLGIAGVQGILGAYQTQQAAEQARKAKEEMMSRAAPYKAQADEMITKARSGELTPVGQQQLQAVQAQAAQGAQARGGVGAQQAQAQVEAYRQQLLQGQYDYGLKLANISDQIALGAIKTGLEADRYINAATMDYFNNAIRMFQGQSPQVAGRQPTDTTTPRA